MRNLEAMFCPDFQIGLSVAKLILLPYLNIPFPTQYPFDEYGVRNVRGDLSVRGDGFPSCVWGWTGLTRVQVNTIMDYVTSTDASGPLYIRTISNTRGNVWGNYLTQVLRPVLTGTNGSRAGYRTDAYTDVTIPFSALVAQ